MHGLLRCITVKTAGSFKLALFSRVPFRFLSKGIDESRVPVLRDEDLEESFVRGSGPGGQAVAKTNNKVVLTHKPTGIVVQCHITRSLFENRREARKLLIAKLDQLYNGDQSVEAQLQRLEAKKQSETARRKQKLQAKKRAWKEREFGGSEEGEKPS
uniref:Prokaryotic-type class I peptide chain release factors domain-containing protein n=1 Tax=Anopheles farauti TaxID=69004 RepID=A0A182R1D0_9DIPT